MPFRPPFRTTQIADLPPGDDGPSPDELVDFGAETTDAFVARTGSQAPAPLGATDAVPVFRSDLQIGKGASAGLFEVGDPATGRHFTLYEFELSIARMLDGRRHASDVIENGVRLGIPVDLDGLNKFVRQLWRYGFLAEPGAASPAAEGEERGWGERVKWDEATRTLFQTGLRLMRQGRPQDAQSYFQAVLDADPGNAEATELLAAIERGETLAAGPIGARAARRAAEAPRRGKGRAIALAVTGVAAVAGAAAWFVAQRGWIAAPPPPPPVAAPAPTPPPPRPAWRTAAVQRREHPAMGAVTAPARGGVRWRKADGAAVIRGEAIGTIVPRRGRPGVPVRATAAGRLSLGVPGRAQVAKGDSIAAVRDPERWVLEAVLDGAPPPVDAACELRGDDPPDRTGCRLESIRRRPGGSLLEIAVSASDAPWLERARALRVLVAPPGAATDPGAAEAQ